MEESTKPMQPVPADARSHKTKCNGSGGIRTHASEETGALNQRLRPLGHATWSILMYISTVCMGFLQFTPCIHQSLYSSVAERWSCKPKVMSSILIGGKLFLHWLILALIKFKNISDPDVIRTRSLLIWSQTRYRCATESSV